MTPQEVIDLLPQPQRLLRRCYVNIVGGVGHTGPNGQATVQTFRVTVDNDNTVRGFTTGVSGVFGTRKDRPNVMMFKQDAMIDPPPADHFNAYYIPMVQIGDVMGGNSHYTLPTVGNMHVAITSQITGCVFSIGSDGGGAVLVSHVQPPSINGMPRDQRQVFARASGGTGMVGNMRQLRHGRDYDMDSDRIAVIGALDGGRWRFYTQKASYSPDNQTWSVRSSIQLIDIG